MLMATTKSCVQNVLFDNTMFYFLFPLLGGAIYTSCRSTHTHTYALVYNILCVRLLFTPSFLPNSNVRHCRRVWLEPLNSLSE